MPVRIASLLLFTALVATSSCKKEDAGDDTDSVTGGTGGVMASGGIGPGTTGGASSGGSDAVGSGATGGRLVPSTECVPGMAVPCAPGCTGMSVCNMQGSGWAGCDCGSGGSPNGGTGGGSSGGASAGAPPAGAAGGAQPGAAGAMSGAAGV